MNVLMIMADQMAARVLGAYGDPVARTPHLDGLAARGTMFENCYCNSPLCVPSRQSLVTGRLAGAVGAYDNGAELPASVPTFMHHFRRAGYHVAASGKMHFVGPDQYHGLHDRVTPDIYPAGLDWTPDWRDAVRGNAGTSVRKLDRSGLCTGSEQLDYDNAVQAAALEYLRTSANNDPEQPFFLWVSYTHPHDPFAITAEYWDRYRGVDIPPPLAPDEPDEDRHPYNRWLQTHHEIDVARPSPEVMAQSRRAYYGMVSYVDDMVGQLLATLDDLGLADDTAVVFASDHGEMLGEHGMWFKRTFYDGCCRVPLIVRRPGDGCARRVSSVVSLVDLLPTLLDVADLPAATHAVDGHSLAGALNDSTAALPDRAIVEYFGEGVLQPMRLVRQGRYKYVVVHGESPLLFDMVADPAEQTNLAGRLELAGVEQALRAAVFDNWDPAAARENILASQQARLMICQAEQRGRRRPWDVAPVTTSGRVW